MADAQTATDNSGQYAFTGLRSGTYSVEISGFDGDEVGFGSVSSSATVGVGESEDHQLRRHLPAHGGGSRAG